VTYFLSYTETLLIFCSVLLEPRIARETGVGRTLEPREARFRVAQLRQRRTKAVGHVVVHVRAAQDFGDACARLFSHSDGGFDRGERGLRPDIRAAAASHGREHFSRPAGISDVVPRKPEVVAHGGRIGSRKQGRRLLDSRAEMPAKELRSDFKSIELCRRGEQGPRTDLRLTSDGRQRLHPAYPPPTRSSRSTPDG